MYTCLHIRDIVAPLLIPDFDEVVLKAGRPTISRERTGIHMAAKPSLIRYGVPTDPCLSLGTQG
jgi:hypothetical protein